MKLSFAQRPVQIKSAVNCAPNGPAGWPPELYGPVAMVEIILG
jgi:hypothetical protein